MVSGLALAPQLFSGSPQRSHVDVLLIGLGGGALATFLWRYFEHVRALFRAGLSRRVFACHVLMQVLCVIPRCMLKPSNWMPRLWTWPNGFLALRRTSGAQLLLEMVWRAFANWMDPPPTLWAKQQSVACPMQSQVKVQAQVQARVQAQAQALAQALAQAHVPRTVLLLANT